MAKKNKSDLTKLLSSDIEILSRDRLLGKLQLNTNNGLIELALNREAAEMLMTDVVDFLQAGKGEDAPTFHVERSK